ncbi:MAG: hypothetical protein P8185_09045 [Deltaproteobacteria bacterium]|jgi:hypothetical protein
MKRIIIRNAFVLAVFFVLYACAGIPLKDYEPRTADEEEIIKVIMAHEKAWNEQDISVFMSTFQIGDTERK